MPVPQVHLEMKVVDELCVCMDMCERNEKVPPWSSFAFDGEVYRDKVLCKISLHVSGFFVLGKVWLSEDE